MVHKKHQRGPNAHTRADAHAAQRCRAQGRLVGPTFRDHLRRLCRNVTFPDGRHLRQIHDLASGWADAERDEGGEWTIPSDDEGGD